MPPSNVVRTLAIVRRLAEGDRLTLPDGHILAMGADMAIGYATQLSPPDGDWYLSLLERMDLAALDALLTQYGIGNPK